jgi:hypothetical protein
MIEDQQRERPDPQPVHAVMALRGHADPPFVIASAAKQSPASGTP